MRICHISDCYLPRLGGIEVQVSELAKRQVVMGHDVHVITATPGHKVREGVEIIDGVTVHRVTAKLPFELPVHPRTRRNVAPLLGRLDPEVVHTHLGVVSPFAWGGIRAAVGVHRPVLATVHSVWGGMARSSYGATNSLSKWTAKGVQPAAVSHVAAARIEAAMATGVPVLITPNGVDPADWNADRRLLPPADTRTDPVRFVTAMRLAPRKRAIALLEIFSDAHLSVGGRRGLTLRIAGDGPQRPRLQSFIEENDLVGRVELLGRLTRADLQDLYLDSDVFIQPSVKESFGLAALEARSTGLPVIARSQTGLTEFVHPGVEGLLGDTDADLIEAIVQLTLRDDVRDAIMRHNVEVPPLQVWDNVLGIMDEAYATTIARAAS